MCARRVGSRIPKERKPIQELMMQARLLEQQAQREADPALRSRLEREAAGLRSEVERRLRRCVESQSVCASGE